MIEVVATLSSSISKSATRRKEQHLRSTTDTPTLVFPKVVVVVAAADDAHMVSDLDNGFSISVVEVDDDENRLLPKQLLLRALGLGTNKTLPS